MYPTLTFTTYDDVQLLWGYPLPHLLGIRYNPRDPVDPTPPLEITTDPHVYDPALGPPDPREVIELFFSTEIVSVRGLRLKGLFEELTGGRGKRISTYDFGKVYWVMEIHRNPYQPLRPDEGCQPG
jgi:hypothetical protein